MPLPTWKMQCHNVRELVKTPAAPCPKAISIAPVINICNKLHLVTESHSGLMVSALDTGSGGPGSSPDRGHCVVFLGKTLNSHGRMLGSNLRRTSIPSRESSNIPRRFMLQKPKLRAGS